MVAKEGAFRQEGGMRQVWITKKGGPEVLQVREAPDPEPKPGEVRVRVKAAGVNFADTMARVGLYRDAPPIPCVVGYETAGLIEGGPRDGQKVIAMTHFGGYSDVVCVPEVMALPMPASLSFAEAAAIPVVYLTAWHMLVELANLKRGQSVLIHAAAGGVGTAALQICKHIGAVTYGTASGGKHARLKEMGLDHAIDYTKDDFEKIVLELTKGRGVDVVLDATGNFKKSFRCLGPVGKLMLFGASGVMPEGSANPLHIVRGLSRMGFYHPLKLMPANKGITGVNMGQLWGETELMTRELTEVLKGVSEGWLKPIVDAEIPFVEAAKAHERLASRQNFGKVVLIP
jgi:NADPH:quinone reductase-like Zn-dependent oxidoreductase